MHVVVNLAVVVSKNKNNYFCLQGLIRSLLFNRWKTKLITSCVSAGCKTSMLNRDSNP